MNLSNVKIGTRLYVAFSAVVLMWVLLVSALYVNFSKLVQANGWNVHTYEVMAEVNSMLKSLINIETGQRGFALTGKEDSLEPYVSGQKEFMQHWEKTRSLTSDNPTQQARLEKFYWSLVPRMWVQWNRGRARYC